ncbi:MAG: acetyl-CoA carboxylase biotin carboxyl carrier protein [Sedimentisphaerales bacterium]|nr:acetyl-CoA carboxylase biotin carboxyl carrier protein [Sedimentisphaerales bacterium]
MANKDIDLKKVKELIELMKQNGLEELEIRQDDDKIYLRRNRPQPTHVPAVTTLPIMNQQFVAGDKGTEALGHPDISQIPAHEEEMVEVKSPIVGTFYAKPSPDSEPYVEIGSTVGPQTVVCIIEAMKVMNEIKAETSGVIADVLVSDGQAVEYGQVLFKVKPE